MSEAVREAFTLPPGTVLDATAGGGGHTAILLELGHRVIALDRDPAAIERLRRKFDDRVTLIHSNFGSAPINDRVDGILADLGFSSDQLADAARGFSFDSEGPLDMRMSGEGETAADLVERLPAGELADLIYRYSEETESRRIARAIAGKRFESAKAFASAVASAKKTRGKINPATKTFQALRIAVNHELDELESLLARAPALLRPNGRIAIITFHSLEDRIVKETFARWAGKCLCPPRLPICVCGAKKIAQPLWKRARTADEDEITTNPRARSAKIRAMIMQTTRLE